MICNLFKSILFIWLRDREDHRNFRILHRRRRRALLSRLHNKLRIHNLITYCGDYYYTLNYFCFFPCILTIEIYYYIFFSQKQNILLEFITTEKSRFSHGFVCEKSTYQFYARYLNFVTTILVNSIVRVFFSLFADMTNLRNFHLALAIIMWSSMLLLVCCDDGVTAASVGGTNPWLMINNNNNNDHEIGGKTIAHSSSSGLGLRESEGNCGVCVCYYNKYFVC